MNIPEWENCLQFCNTLNEGGVCNDGIIHKIENSVNWFQEKIFSHKWDAKSTSNDIFHYRNELTALVTYVLINELQQYYNFANMVLMNLNFELNRGDLNYRKVKRLIRQYKINPAFHCPHCGKKLSQYELNKSIGRLRPNKCFHCGAKIGKNKLHGFILALLSVICVNAIAYFVPPFIANPYVLWVFIVIFIFLTLALVYLYNRYILALIKRE